MKFELFNDSRMQEVIDLFKSVFSTSEGEAEGQSIGALVADMIATTDRDDLIGCVAIEEQRVVGCIFLSRFWLPSGQLSFLLSPVAVRSDNQKIGTGQQLINFGLDQLRLLNAKLVFTYGDPDYYCKTGFEKITEDIVQAPCKMSQPIGWLAQALDGETIQPVQGTTRCIKALSDPKYW